MKKIGHSGSSLFLMEIILNIFLFSVLLVISLQIIMKAHTLTDDTTKLHRAVTVCSNIAECFQSGNGTLESIRDVYSLAGSTGDMILVYLDDDFAECKKTDAVYVVTAGYLRSSEKESSSRLEEIEITCTLDGETIYSVNACHYEPISVHNGIGGV
jgi:hypothetical protein